MKNKHRFTVLVSLVSCIALFAFNSRPGDPILDKLVVSLQRWTDSIPQEKVYLHMDKPYYVLGDTLWFKGYLTIGSRHQLSKLSGAVYVDLISEKDSILQQLKLPVTSGMVIGDFILKDDYHQGSYRIRAYTQWMRNAGDDYFFDRTFLVGDIAGGSIVAKADFSYRNDKGMKTLTALLNYTNDEGKALGEKDVRYEIWINHKPILQQNSKTDALGSLRITIPDDIKQHPEGAYIHTILQGSDKYPVSRDFPVKATLIQSDVQFFPESGSLVNGITSRVAFKAVGTDGLGIHIKGNVIDNDNNEVAKLETFHAGMGSFVLRPQAGKIYKANISFDDGSTKSISLPKPVDEGYVLSIYQPNPDSILLRIHASVKMLGLAVDLLAHTGGEVIFATPVKIDNETTSVWLKKKSFPTGVAQFTLFNNAGEPLNERLAFIRSNDMMHLEIKTNKTTYNSKERVLVGLTAKDGGGNPTAGNFSVSVIDESKVPFQENKESTIFSNLLLASDLKGYIEEPNYYFARQGEDVDKALDNLMLTQGYRRFVWKAISNTITAKPKYAVEGWGSSISGTVTTLGHKILPDAKVDLISIKARVAKNTITDSRGRFTFDNLFITDSIKLTIQARSQTKSGLGDKVILTLDSLPSTKQRSANKNWPDISTNVVGALKAYLSAAKKEDEVYEKMGLLDKVHRLREVNITAKKRAVADANITPQSMFKIKEQSADQVINVDPEEASNYINLSQYLQSRMQGIRIGSGQNGSTLELLQGNSNFRTSFRSGSQPITLYIDGRRIDQPDAVADALDGSYDPQDIAKIEVVHSNQAMINFLGGPAVLILTKLGTSRKAGYNPSVANITPKGFNKVREFYSPKYDSPNVNLRLPDLRSSIYWNAYLKTDAQGKGTFSFYNADGPGTYKLIIEGINADGQIGRSVYRYTVDATPAAGSAQIAMPFATDKNLSLITAPLDSFNKRLPVEKVYLHTDKPSYNIGDTLWFKAYVVNGADLTPSKISGLLYVELDNDSSEMIKRVSIRLKDGLCWAQIPLTKKIFREGGYTLRAYTNWMQNFGEQYVFNQRFYFGLPVGNIWLVNSNAMVERADDKDQLNVSMSLKHTDHLLSPVALKKVEVKIYDQWHYLYKEEMQTGIDGSLKFSHNLDSKADGRRVRVEIRSLDKADGYKVVHVPLTIKRIQNIDLQFLPEGGKLVAGISSTIGFKAVGEDGKGASLSGTIYDSKGNKSAQFTTLHNGMGSFEFTPAANEVYTARVEKPTGLNKIFKLPGVAAVGTVMHIVNNEQDDKLKVSLFGVKSLGTDSICYLIGTGKNIVYYSQQVNEDGEVEISKKLFPTGISRFTLFRGTRPINERAVFIDNHDQLVVKIAPNKKSYGKRDSVSLEIEVKDKTGLPIQGNFSLAVTDDSQVKPDSLGNNNITVGLLLSSELMGTIENPGYYINRKDELAWKALDNLLLTQGWKSYDWKDIFAPAKPPAFKAEKEFEITGRVANAFNKPLANTEVLIRSQKPSFIITGRTNDLGVYTFKNLPTIDSGSFFIQANDSKGKPLSFGELKVNKFNAPNIPSAGITPLTPWYLNTDTPQLNYVKRKMDKINEGLKLTDYVLKEVKINEKKIIKDSSNPYGPGNSDMAFDENDIKASEANNLYDFLIQQVPGLKLIGVTQQYPRIPLFKLDKFTVDPILIDGNKWTVDVDMAASWEEIKDDLRSYPAVNIRGVEVIYSRKYTNRSAGLEGKFRAYDFAKIIVTSRNGLGWFRNFKNTTAQLRPLPVLYPQQFYAPKYNYSTKSNESDYRSTLYWEPNINTNQNGKAKVWFYTSDVIDKYTVSLQGGSASGEVGSSQIKVSVQNK